MRFLRGLMASALRLNYSAEAAHAFLDLQGIPRGGTLVTRIAEAMVISRETAATLVSHRVAKNRGRMPAQQGSMPGHSGSMPGQFESRIYRVSDKLRMFYTPSGGVLEDQHGRKFSSYMIAGYGDFTVVHTAPMSLSLPQIVKGPDTYSTFCILRETIGESEALRTVIASSIARDRNVKRGT